MKALSPTPHLLFILASLVSCLLVAREPLHAQPTSENTLPESSTNRVRESRRLGTSRTNDPIVRIRDEGLNHSHVMEILEYLTDVIGPRLTGSPNLKRANDWTRDQFLSWGMTNAHLEAWGPFGRGWSL